MRSQWLFLIYLYIFIAGMATFFAISVWLDLPGRMVARWERKGQERTKKKGGLL